MLIALDTSTRYAGVALWNKNGFVAETNWLAGREQTSQLLPEVERLLNHAGITPADLTAVSVALGPGSFNGLRVGLSTAKGLAQALDLPLLGVPTLDIIAAGIPATGTTTLLAILEAGRGRIAIAFYKAKGGHWQRQGDFSSTTVDDLPAQLGSAGMITGDLSEAEREVLSGRLPKQVYLSSAGLSVRRASFLAEIGWRRHALGERDDLVNLEPLYMHAPVIGKPRPGILSAIQE